MTDGRGGGEISYIPYTARPVVNKHRDALLSARLLIDPSPRE